MSRLLPLVIAFVILGGAPARAELITLDFNVFPGTFADRGGEDWSLLTQPYTPQQGISMPETTLIDSFFARLYSDALGASYALNGSGILAINASGTVLSAGAPFSLVSVDVLPHFPADLAGSDVRFTGLSGGAIVGTSDALIGRTDGWHTLSLRSLGMVDEIAITTFNHAEANPQEFWIDNLTIHRAPEPGTLLLIGIGVATAASQLRRRRSR